MECEDDADAPEGWTKWIIQGYRYIYAENDGTDVFYDVMGYMEDNRIPLVGAVHDYSCPQTGKNYMFFPIRKL